MQHDARDMPEYHTAQALLERLWQPGTGRIVDAAEIDVAPDGRYAVFAGTIVDALVGTPPTRVCRVDLGSGDMRVLTFGPHTDRSPMVSPDGRLIAFLSDRREAQVFQLFLLNLVSGAARSTPPVDGWVEYLQWSPDGRLVLLGVAGHGADVAAIQGAIPSGGRPGDLPRWVPTVETGDEGFRWRKLWCYDVATDTVRPVTAPNQNVWEAAWCGTESVIAITSPGPSEGLWYSATLQIVDLASGASRQLYAPRDQLGWPAASPDGQRVAVVEAVCSDRGIAAGELRLIDVDSGAVQVADTHEIDVSHTEWRSNRFLLIAGQRGFETVVGRYDVQENALFEVWGSKELTAGGYNVTVAGLGEPGDCVLVGEGFRTAPEIATIRRGEYRAVRSFDTGYGDLARSIHAVEAITWRASDGLEIQGWLLQPTDKPPHPLVMIVHGGPVSHWRPVYLGRARPLALMMVQRGYALFLPNPRGSSGRGQEFARHVVGDMGGADTFDCLSGLDHLTASGIADPKRLGVMGGSYGGFMTTWLITQDSRFAAAVAIAPLTNMVTQHLVSNIPHFVKIFLADHYENPTGRYYERSPIMHAHRAKTPTLNICGALDRCTPPEEAVQFHSALLEHGVTSVLVTYPEEGHGIRKAPAAIDYSARVVSWFDAHLRAESLSSPPKA